MKTLYQIAMDDSPSCLINKDNGYFSVLKILNRNNRNAELIIKPDEITAITRSISNCIRTEEYLELENIYTPIRNLQQISLRSHIKQ